MKRHWTNWLLINLLRVNEPVLRVQLLRNVKCSIAKLLGLLKWARARAEVSRSWRDPSPMCTLFSTWLLFIYTKTHFDSWHLPHLSHPSLRRKGPLALYSNSVSFWRHFPDFSASLNETLSTSTSIHFIIPMTKADIKNVYGGGAWVVLFFGGE